MARVNPPPQLVLPDELVKLGPSVVNFFQQQNRFDLQMWQRVGGGTDSIAELSSNSQTGFNPMTQELFRRVGSGLEFTIDTSGFTIDTSLLTTDKAAI